jgi:hypothetical protein
VFQLLLLLLFHLLPLHLYSIYLLDQKIRVRVYLLGQHLYVPLTIHAMLVQQLTRYLLLLAVLVLDLQLQLSRHAGYLASLQ